MIGGLFSRAGSRKDSSIQQVHAPAPDFKGFRFLLFSGLKWLSHHEACKHTAGAICWMLLGRWARRRVGSALTMTAPLATCAPALLAFGLQVADLVVRWRLA